MSITVTRDLATKPWVYAAAGSLLLAHAVLALAAASRLGPSADDSGGMAAGFALLTRREMVLNPEQPPLGKAVAALPLLGLHPPIDPRDPRYLERREFLYGRAFLFDSGVDPDRLLARSRAAMLLFPLALGVAIFLVARRIHGSAGGLLALGFFAFDPSFLGHGTVIQYDVALALFVFAGAVAFDLALASGRVTAFAASGALLGLGLATKFTGVYLLGLWGALWLHRRCPRSAPVLRGAAVALLAAGAVLLLAYAPIGLHWLVEGVRWQVEHATRGHVSYFMGELRTHGSVFYFPVAFLVKTPLETLVALGLALGTIARDGGSPRIRAALVAAGTFLALLLPATINIGHRYMLPVYPFLFVVVGALGDPARAWLAPGGAPSFSRSRVAAMLALLLALRTLALFPDYLGFTNLLAGRHPERILADSNLDWGQDLPRLAAWLAERGHPEIRLAYTGMDSPKHRGIRHVPATCERTPGLHAASINAVLGILPGQKRGCFAWLAEEEPIARIGTSMLVYDVPPR